MNKTQPWIFSPRFDLSLIIGPAIFITAMVLIFNQQIQSVGEMPLWIWFVLVIGIDAGHVYSTIFRTYLDRDELNKRATLYTLVPLLAWISGCFLYSIDALLFWRVLAYFAVFHFVRQQYGFMMIYARVDAKKFKILDQAAIYLATIYPLIYWHCHARDFHWFIEGDFFSFNAGIFFYTAQALYFGVFAAYFMKEIFLLATNKFFNWPKNLLLFSTAASWFVGIIFFNNDLIFSASNIIAHGIAYSALIWIYSFNQSKIKNSYVFPWLKNFFTYKKLPFYLILVLLLAFAEEALWDGFIWHEHQLIFQIPAISSDAFLVWLVPLLALPQTTHYILDAFIWRLKDDVNWKKTLFFNLSKKS
jgi:hypothetical protein